MHWYSPHTTVVMPQVSIYRKAGQPSGKGQNLLFFPYWESLLAQGKYAILHHLKVSWTLPGAGQRLQDCNSLGFPLMHADVFQLCFLLLADKPWIWNIPYTQAPDTHGNIWVPSWAVQGAHLHKTELSWKSDQRFSLRVFGTVQVHPYEDLDILMTQW